MKIKRSIATAGLVVALGGSCALVATPPQTAHAVPSAEDVAAAQSRMEQLGSELQGIQQNLADATSALESTSAEISQKEAQIAQGELDIARKRSDLGMDMKGNYKSGAQSVLDFVLGATSAEDLVSRVYYLDKISGQQAAAIREIQEAEALLQTEREALIETQRTQQQKVEDLQRQVGEYQSSVSEARAYFEGLDEELRESLAAQESASVQTAVSAVEQAREAERVIEENRDTPAPAPVPEAEPVEPEPTPDVPTPEPSTPSYTPNGGRDVSAFYNYVGYPYVWGGASPSDGGFDCSGLICYVYGWKYGHDAYAMMIGAMNSGSWKTSIDQLEVGDLVFTYADGSHVGVYVGNGMILHAANPSVGVVVAPIWSFYGGGPY